MIRFLLDNGADYEAKNKLGQAPADIPLLKRNSKNSQFALVELYTSESCSSCPPAERLTSEIRRMALAKRLNIFCISFHVDYFDGGSWSDGFSDGRFSARQRTYEHKRFSGLYYTPQMIVNGKHQMLGHNRADAFLGALRGIVEQAALACWVAHPRVGARRPARRRLWTHRDRRRARRGRPRTGSRQQPGSTCARSPCGWEPALHSRGL